jgi:hypothetical protein
VSASGVSQYFTVNAAVGYLSSSDKRLVVGLDHDITAKLVEIRWPSKVVQKFENVAAGQILIATEPASAPPPVARNPESELRRDFAEAVAKARSSTEPHK